MNKKNISCYLKRMSNLFKRKNPLHSQSIFLEVLDPSSLTTMVRLDAVAALCERSGSCCDIHLTSGAVIHSQTSIKTFFRMIKTASGKADRSLFHNSLGQYVMLDEAEKRALIKGRHLY